VGQIETDQGQELLDIGHVTEINYNKADDVRFCEADAFLNTGSTHLGYRNYHGPSGKLLIEAKEGNDAFNAFGLSTEAYSQKQYDAKVQVLKDAMKEYQATHPNRPAAKPDYENVPGAIPFGTPYHSGSAQNPSRAQSQSSDDQSQSSNSDAGDQSPPQP
jgi:hypothetical protein